MPYPDDNWGREQVNRRRQINRYYDAMERAEKSRSWAAWFGWRLRALLEAVSYTLRGANRNGR